MKYAVFFAVLTVFLSAGNASAAVNLVSDSPLEYYAQGGIVKNGIAYFTSDPGANVPTPTRDASFPFITAFNAQTLEKIGTYHFQDTYDSSPYVYQNKEGVWLIAARERPPRSSVPYRLTARRLDTDEHVWSGPANQTGSIYFGTSTYHRADGSRIFYAASGSGLHANCGETGAELWFVPQPSYAGTTPAVDQANGWVFYQGGNAAGGNMYKIRAETGEVLASKNVAWPTLCSSYNTVLVNDSYGYYVLTYWYTGTRGTPQHSHWDCALRIYDQNLDLVWEKTGLPYNKKSTITYWDGKMALGTGDHWSTEYSGTNWKKITAYRVNDGSVAWVCDISDIPYKSIFNMPYFNGHLYVETSYSPSHLIRIRASDGQRMEVYPYGHRVSSCGIAIIAHGKMFSGNLSQDRVVVTKLAENHYQDWPGAFYDPQTNTNALPDTTGVTLVPMRQIGRWSTDLSINITGPPSPTELKPIPFTIEFSRPVTHLTAAKIHVTNGKKEELTGSGSTYTLWVTPAAPGPVTCQIPDWAVLDPDENGNRASSVVEITYTPPIACAMVWGGY